MFAGRLYSHLKVEAQIVEMFQPRGGSYRSEEVSLRLIKISTTICICYVKCAYLYIL